MFRSRRGVSSLAMTLVLVLVLGVVVLASGVYFAGFLDGSRAPPSTTFTFEYDASTAEVVITHHQGETIDADRLLVRGGGRSESAWRQELLRSGDRISVHAYPGDRIRVLWEGDEETELGSYAVPRDAGPVGGIYWRTTDEDRLSDFRNVFRRSSFVGLVVYNNDNPKVESGGEGIHFRPNHSGAGASGYASYDLPLPANDGRMTVSAEYDGRAYGDSGIRITAVDSEGSRVVVHCNPDAGGRIDCPDGTDSASFDRTVTVTAPGGEFERLSVELAIRNGSDGTLTEGVLQELSVKLR